MGKREHGRYHRVEKAVSVEVDFLVFLVVNELSNSNLLCKHFSSSRF